MALEALAFAVRIFAVPYGWFLAMIQATDTFGIYVGFFAIFTIYRLVIAPAIGGGTGSDTVKRPMDKGATSTSDSGEDFTVEWGN